MNNTNLIDGPDIKIEVNESHEKIHGFLNNLGISYGLTLKTVVNIYVENEVTHDDITEEVKENEGEINISKESAVVNKFFFSLAYYSEGDSENE